MSNSVTESPLARRSVAFLVANEGVEQVELTDPWKAVADAGGTPVLVSIATGDVQAYNHLDRGDVFQATVAALDASAADYVGLVLPGGVSNPDQLRMDYGAVRFVRSFFEAGKPVAVICHGPWTLIEADVVRDRHITSWPSLQTDLRNAGARWADEEVVVCTSGPSTIVSSRKPDDLPSFCKHLVDVFSSPPAGGPRPASGADTAGAYGAVRGQNPADPEGSHH
ncbi:MAG: peptidase family protein [Ilumatobacteraceae bacterium]|nr:peptidase family protein [Ilumatobacteraceae bacterium]